MYKILNKFSGLFLLLLLAIDTQAFNDPTKPPGFSSSPVARKPLVLNSLLVSKTRKVAVINGKPMSEGDVVEGAKLLKINQSSVIMAVRGKRLVLKPKRVSVRQEK